MKLAQILADGRRCLAAEVDGRLLDLSAGQERLPLDIRVLCEDEAAMQLARDAVQSGKGRELDPAAVTFLPVITQATKIICVGLNYADHAAESPYEKPNYPVLFIRVESSLIGHQQPLIRPKCSPQFDYEGEMVAIIGKAGRNIAKADAEDHVIGYSVFNEGSIRDYQFKGPQWTLGKNFDGTGAFGPYFVSADEVPAGGRGLQLTTRLNGEVVQSANTDDMIFTVAEIIAAASEAMTLNPGDVLVTGTPAGVGFARKPQLFMKDGDRCEVEIEGIGLLSNPVQDE